MRADTAPVCAYEQAGCHLPSLADLFDRVVQQSSRMHGISSDLHSEFVSPSDLIHHHPSHPDLYSITFCQPFCSDVNVCVFAGAIFLSQQELHWEKKVSHTWHIYT